MHMDEAARLMEKVILPALLHPEFVSRQYPRALVLEHWSRHEHHHYDLGSQGAPLFEKAYEALAARLEHAVAVAESLACALPLRRLKNCADADTHLSRRAAAGDTMYTRKDNSILVAG